MALLRATDAPGEGLWTVITTPDRRHDRCRSGRRGPCRTPRIEQLQAGRFHLGGVADDQPGPRGQRGDSDQCIGRPDRPSAPAGCAEGSAEAASAPGFTWESSMLNVSPCPGEPLVPWRAAWSRSCALVRSSR